MLFVLSYYTLLEDLQAAISTTTSAICHTGYRPEGAIHDLDLNRLITVRESLAA